MRRLLVVVMLLACGHSAGADAPAVAPPPDAVKKDLKLSPLVRGLVMPVDVDALADGRLLIIEKPGRIRVFKAGKLLDKPFLDVAALVSSGNEQGLLGLALHPGYAQNGRFFVNYTDKQGDTHVVEYKVSADADVADPQSARELMKVEQPYANHNGGNVVVGPDGWLWVGMGDGGAAGDPKGNGQKDGSRLGKMLRLQIDGGSKIEVWAKGLRNPWRYAFDGKTGDLYIGDVGQDKWEEVDVASAAQVKKGGLNYGWNPVEGTHCFKRGCDPNKYEPPVLEYPHGDGCSVTGGVVYRGKALPALDGTYWYADYCTGLLRSFRWSAGKLADHWDWRPTLGMVGNISAFGTDAAGELLVVTLNGTIFRLGK